MFEIIKQIVLLHKDKPSKYEMQWWLILLREKAVQTCMALFEKVIGP